MFGDGDPLARYFPSILLFVVSQREDEGDLYPLPPIPYVDITATVALTHLA